MLDRSTLQSTAAQALVRSLLWAARGAGWALWTVQRLLAWLDGPHPLAQRLKPGVDWLGRHPRQMALAGASALMVSAGGALAVAQLGPDPSELPVRTLVESVQPLDLESQAASLELQGLSLLRADTTRANDSPEALLRRLGVVDPSAARFMRKDPLVREALARSGRSVSAETQATSGLQRLSVRWLRQESDTHFQRLVLLPTAQGWQSRLETAPLSASVRMSGGTVQSSLYAASDEARVPDAVVRQLTEIFSSQIDFHRAMRKGARFAVVYEVLEADGEPLRIGKVLSAEFVNGDKLHQAVWFQEPGKRGDYYSLDGRSLRRAYLASPVPYSRKTSGMGMRLHPIFQTMRAHVGVDYAAPTGTPAYSVGDGTVEFAGTQGGYGNTVIVRHSPSHSTVYAHLSRMEVRKGQNVNRGQLIGAVGSTGWSTGPHLHFEFRINGVHVDPQKVLQQAQAEPISPTARAAFDRHAQSVRQQLAAAVHMRDGGEF